MEPALSTLALQQQSRNTDTWQVDYLVSYPAFKAQLTQLFLELEDPTFLEPNAPTSQQEWLTEHTNYYEVIYGSPW